jgi:ferredoxin
MYVILTTKPGQFRTEPGDHNIVPRELYDYLFCGRLRARFVIAELNEASARVRIIDEGDAPLVNNVPAKFLPKFKTLDDARMELDHLARFGDLDVKLVRHDMPSDPNVAAAQVRITFLPQNGRTVEAAPGSSLLRVSLREQGGIPFKCGGGICGTCKCRIVTGLENTDAVKPKERKHLTVEQFAQGWRMACQTFVRGDVSVTW